MPKPQESSLEAALQPRALPLIPRQRWDCCWCLSVITNDSAVSKANEVTCSNLFASGKCSFTKGWKLLIVFPPSHITAKKWGVPRPRQQPLALWKETVCEGRFRVRGDHSGCMMAQGRWGSKHQQHETSWKGKVVFFHN